MPGSVVDSLLRYADVVKSDYKGIVKKHTKSGRLHDWAKSILFSSITQSCRTANLSAQHKSFFVQCRQNQQASAIVTMFYGTTTKLNECRLVVATLFISLNERPLSDFCDL